MLCIPIKLIITVILHPYSYIEVSTVIRSRNINLERAQPPRASSPTLKSCILVIFDQNELKNLHSEVDIFLPQFAGFFPISVHN